MRFPIAAGAGALLLIGVVAGVLLLPVGADAPALDPDIESITVHAPEGPVVPPGAVPPVGNVPDVEFVPAPGQEDVAPAPAPDPNGYVAPPPPNQGTTGGGDSDDDDDDDDDDDGTTSDDGGDDD